MGIKGLYKLIKTHSPDAIEELDYTDIRGWTLGIDASLVIYQWCSMGKAHNIVNMRGELINHVQGAFYRTTSMIRAGVIPVYVFDGSPPDSKAETLAARKVLRDAGKSVRVPGAVFTEVAKLLDLMGVPTVQAPGEAEAQICTMCKEGILHAAATEDTDVVPLGAQFMIRGMTNDKFMIIDRNKVLAGLELSSAAFIDLCILLGCDHTITLPKIGPVRALKLIKKWGSIEAVLAGESITPPKEFDYISARREFIEPTVQVGLPVQKLRPLTHADIEVLETFLVDIHGLDKKRISRTLKLLALHHGIEY